MSGAARLTIGELAEAAGMTVRNIRNHQSRGLLPPPDVVARTGYYGREHLERLRRIREMQADGYNLEAIRRLLSGSDLAQAATLPAEAPGELDAGELERRFGPHGPAALGEAERLRLLVPLGDGRWAVPSPALLRAVEAAVERGVDLAAALRVVGQVRGGCEGIARAFVGAFIAEVWRPGLDEAQAAAAVEELRPVASRTVLAVFDQALTAEAGRALAPHG
jgi:DNA-binding transcriptional MerR regulator